jgi:hypothetical protein
MPWWQGPTDRGHRNFENLQTKEVINLPVVENLLHMAMSAVCLLLFNVSSRRRRHCVPELFRLCMFCSFHLFLGRPTHSAG